MKVYKSINEFLANKPGVAPSKPGISPDVKPGTPEINPKYPSPIRRDKPKVKPDPKATEKTKETPKRVNPDPEEWTKKKKTAVPYPGPIRRDKPMVKPDPKAGIETILPTATEEELIAKLISNLRSNKGEIEVNLATIKNRYKK
jgi:hypothetical protein